MKRNAAKIFQLLMLLTAGFAACSALFFLVDSGLDGVFVRWFEETFLITESHYYPAEGWAEVPPELTEQAMSLLPWITLDVKDGKITGVSDNAEARAAAKAEAAAKEEAERLEAEKPTEAEQLRADLDYYAIMTGVEL